MVLEILVFAGVGALLGGGYMVWKSRQQEAAPKALPAPANRTPTTIQVNDIVTHLGTDYLVETVLVYDDDGDEWFAYLLADGSDTIWLAAEEDDTLELGFYREVKDLTLTERPGERLTYQGVEYTLEEWGKAVVTRTRESGTKKLGPCTYFDYESDDGKHLSVTQWGEGEFEVSVGESVHPSTLEILPGDLVS